MKKRYLKTIYILMFGLTLAFSCVLIRLGYILISQRDDYTSKLHEYQIGTLLESESESE